MKRQGKVIIAILIVILIAIFSVMNTESIPIHFGFTTVSWPLVLVLLVAIFLGAIFKLSEQKDHQAARESYSSFENPFKRNTKYEYKSACTYW